MRLSTGSLLAFSLLPALSSAAPFISPRQVSDDLAPKPISIGFKQRPKHLGLGLAQLKEGIEEGVERRQVDDEAELFNWRDVRYIASIVIAGQELDVMLDTGSTDTFVYTTHPTPLANYPDSILPPLFNNASATGLSDTGMIYSARYGSGNGITETLGHIQFASDVTLADTSLTVTNLTFASLWESSSSTGSSGLLGLGWPLNSVIWPTIREDIYNSTGAYPPLSESQNYFPIVPRLHQEAQIPEALFVIELQKLTDAELAQQTNTAAFAYTETNGTLTLGGYPGDLTRESFTWSFVPYVAFNSDAANYGYMNSTGNRWTTPIDAIYFNDVRLRDTRLQTSIYDDEGYLFALLDSGNPTMTLPQDVMAQITNAYAGNPQNNYLPCDTRFELIYQIAGVNFTLDRSDIFVPSTQALDSLGLGGRATQGCQFQAQVGQTNEDEYGPGTSITYQLGGPFMRSITVAFDYGNILNSIEQPPAMGFMQR